MSEGPSSLPVPAGDPDFESARQLQMELGEQSEWDRVHAEAKKDGVFTGDRLKVIDPVKHKMIVQLLAAGLGLLRIGKLLKVSHHTVAAVRDSSQVAVAAEKGVLSDQMRLVIRLLLERTVDDIESIPLDKVPFFIGVLTDKMQLLDGQATSRIESTRPAGSVTLESFGAFLQNLPRADVTDVKTVEQEPPAASQNGGEGDARQ